jgi:hypothetical protein
VVDVDKTTREVFIFDQKVKDVRQPGLGIEICKFFKGGKACDHF